MRALRYYEEPWPRPFVEGVLLEGIVNEKGEFRCKRSHFVDAIAAKHPEAQDVFNRASAAIRASAPKQHPILAGEDYEQAPPKIA
jgi:hypothetical protein